MNSCTIALFSNDKAKKETTPPRVGFPWLGGGGFSAAFFWRTFCAFWRSHVANPFVNRFALRAPHLEFPNGVDLHLKPRDALSR
jgi:hypothetical protein